MICIFFTFDLNVHAVTLNLMFLADIVWVITQQPLMKEGSYLVCDTIMTNHVLVQRLIILQITSVTLTSVTLTH